MIYTVGRHEEVYIDTPDDLIGREAKVHWHFVERRYSVSLRADNGRWYVVRHRKYETQLFFGKLILTSARFVVERAGARKAYATGKRNVHASVIGIVSRAEFEPSHPVVPCGASVRYSHVLYPEPEFKALPVGYEDHFRGKHMSEWPGIEYAEMLSCGTCPIMKVPSMLAGGIVQYKGSF